MSSGYVSLDLIACPDFYRRYKLCEISVNFFSSHRERIIGKKTSDKRFEKKKKKYLAKYISFCRNDYINVIFAYDVYHAYGKIVWFHKNKLPHCTIKEERRGECNLFRAHYKSEFLKIRNDFLLRRMRGSV